MSKAWLVLWKGVDEWGLYNWCSKSEAEAYATRDRWQLDSGRTGYFLIPVEVDEITKDVKPAITEIAGLPHLFQVRPNAKDLPTLKFVTSEHYPERYALSGWDELRLFARRNSGVWHSVERRMEAMGFTQEDRLKVLAGELYHENVRLGNLLHRYMLYFGIPSEVVEGGGS